MKAGRILGLVLGLCLMLFWGGDRAEGKYPDRPIELVLPVTPGGFVDNTCRMYSEELSRLLKVPVIVNNRAGGGGIEAVSYVMRAKKDGYTLLAGPLNLLLLPIIRKEANYDILKDITPLGHFVNAPSALVVKSDSPFQTLEDLIAYARKNPGKIKYGASSLGAVDYFNVNILCAKTNTKMVAIPFKGGGEAMMALLGGHVELIFFAVAQLSEQIKAGKLRALAIASKTRHPEFPDVPTFTELGHPYPFLLPWTGLFVAAGTPQPVINALVPVVEKVFKNPVVVERARKANYNVDYMGPAQFRKFMEAQIPVVEKIALDVNLIKK